MRLSRTHIDSHYKNNLSTSGLSHFFYVSEAHLSRSFKKTYGQTITDYIHEVRIFHAKELLSGTSASIGSIALNVGYTDLNYFSRVFKAHTGLTPTAYRAKQV